MLHAISQARLDGALIDAATLSGTATQIDIQNIPGTFRHLQVDLMGRGDTAAIALFVNLRLNNDSGSNYDWVGESNTNTADSFAGDVAVSSIRIGLLPAATASADRSGSLSIVIPNYAATVFHKTARSEGYLIWGTAVGNQERDQFAGNWRSTSAVNRVTLLAGADNFITGTSWALYGFN